jgi:hypothetical protein
MGKLSRIEIQMALEKIIKKYDEYCYRFFKHPGLKSAFEDRYFLALKQRLDMQKFLATEISVIGELIGKEEARLNWDVPSGTPVKKESFADRVMKEHGKKIEKYPDVRIHKDANPDVRRLLGALQMLDHKYMPLLQDALKNTNFSFNTQVMLNLDSELRYLSSADEDGVSSKLTRYKGLFNRFPRDYKSIENEEKAYIMAASFFLHDLQDILERVGLGRISLSSNEQEKLNRARAYIDGVIGDFRLKDLQRKNF